MLQALDRALFGGSPAAVPALYTERSPLTYVDAVEAPLLILAGENDSRCPIRQVWNYVGRLRARGVDPRGVHLRHGPRLVRHRGAGAPDGDRARLPRGHGAGRPPAREPAMAASRGGRHGLRRATPVRCRAQANR